MSTGILSNTLSTVRTHGFKAAGFTVLGMGLFLGGCNNSLKAENEELRTENATLKEQVNTCDSEKSSISTQLSSLQGENMRLQSELSMAKTTTTYPPFERDGSTGGRKLLFHPEETFTIAGDTLFSSGSATLKADSRRSIDALLPQIKRASAVRVVGHTDSDPIVKAKDKFPTNQALSKARADAVRSYLVSKGISSSRISTVGKGASEPKGTKKDSRRVEIVVAE